MDKLFSLLSSMQSVTRYSDQSCLKKETVASHTVNTLFIASWLLDKLRKEEAVVINSDEELLLFKSLLFHDLDEVSMGSIPKPAKHRLSDLRDFIHKAEASGVVQLLEEHQLPLNWLDHWRNGYSGEISIILVVSDFLAAVFKAWQEEIMLGNRFFHAVRKDLQQSLYILREQRVRLVIARHIIQMIAASVMVVAVPP